MKSNQPTRKFDETSKRRFKWFNYFTGYDYKNFTSINQIIHWLHRPTDAAALGVFRFCFGILMMIDIPEERGGGQLDVRYGDPKTCHFPIFNALRPFSLPEMGVIYLIMWLGAFGIALGYKFRISCLMFTIPYWYIFLLHKPAWNNHSYLYGLCGILFLFTDAHRYRSIDFSGSGVNDHKIPYWNYFLIKFQFFILYFIAGLKKFSIEWLSGYSMTNLGYHWVFIPFRFILSVEMIELLIIHWFAAIFDFSIAFLMTWKRTRVWVTPFMLSFHLMNSRLFTIGMFPWVCLAEVPLFYSADWPRKIHEKFFIKITKNPTRKNCDGNVNDKDNDPKLKQSDGQAEIIKLTFNQYLRFYLILFYCCLQFFLPYSHSITKGYNNWTNGLYGYSWDMMVHSYDTILTSVKIVDNKNHEIHYLDPYAFTHYDRWTKHADMAVQYAKCIEANLIHDFETNPKTILTSKNLSIYFDVWCSMNGRFQQRVFNPNEDLLRAEWSPFKKTKWILPLLNELNYMRPYLATITNDVLSWSNHSDILFIADFPGLTLENFISPDLENVTLTVLEGAVKFTNHNKTIIESINTGQNLVIRSNDLHTIQTVSPIPSCYTYTYVNRTMKDLNIVVGIDDNVEHDWLPISEELSVRLTNYKQFFYLVGNSLMFLIYGVPMPIRLREIN